MSERNVVDSSGWIEYFSGGPNADFFEAAIENSELLIVPSISIYEMFKRLLAEADGEEETPMADSIILATARAHGAALWTQDSDFKDIEGVRYIEKKD